MIERLRAWARVLKRQLRVAWFVARDAQTPLPIKLWWGFALAYALSPIDLIPDFIPILGFLDDAILVPLMLWLGFRWTQRYAPQALERAREREKIPTAQPVLPVSRLGGALMVSIWALVAFVVYFWWVD